MPRLRMVLGMWGRPKIEYTFVLSPHGPTLHVVPVDRRGRGARALGRDEFNTLVDLLGARRLEEADTLVRDHGLMCLPL